MITKELRDYVRKSTKPVKPDAEGENVDLFFTRIGFTEHVTMHDKAWFLDQVKQSEQGEFLSQTFDELAQGPSYITLGGWIGDQTLALQFMAVAQHFGICRVITPAMFGLSEEESAKAAGLGFVMISGWEVEDDEAEGTLGDVRPEVEGPASPAVPEQVDPTIR